MKQNIAPSQFYERLESIGQYFNRELFENGLPAPLFSLRKGAGPLGHFTPNRWITNSKEGVGEITLNPDLFSCHSWLSLFQTIAHQQCHLWQHTHGHPSRLTYHNTEWASKLEDIGLMPTSSGIFGGRKTGQNISEYAIANGKFLRACVDLLETDFYLPITAKWSDGLNVSAQETQLPSYIHEKTKDRLLSPVGALMEDVSSEPKIKNSANKLKVKYSCPTCSVNVWGKHGLSLLCQDCHEPLSITNRTKPTVSSYDRSGM